MSYQNIIYYFFTKPFIRNVHLDQYVNEFAEEANSKSTEENVKWQCEVHTENQLTVYNLKLAILG